MSIDVFVLTGFLGSGKTSLLREILEQDNGETALIINELGEIGIDHLLLRNVAEDTVLLSNGCLCCTVNSDLVDSLVNLITLGLSEGNQRLRRVVIETTGLANPGPVISSIAHAAAKADLNYAGTVTVVDLVHAASQRVSQREWVEQVAAADLVILSKGDLAEEGVTNSSLHAIKEVNPLAAIVDNRDKTLVPDLFSRSLSSNDRNIKLRLFSRSQSVHGNVESVSVAINGKVDWMRLGAWMVLMGRRHAEQLLRVKAVFFDALTSRVVAVHGVQGQVYPPQDVDGISEVFSQVVVITRGLDIGLVEMSLRAFLGAPMREDSQVSMATFEKAKKPNVENRTAVSG